MNMSVERHIPDPRMSWLLCSLTHRSDPGDGVGVKTEWGEGRDDTRRTRGSEEGPQGVDPPSPREILTNRAPWSSHACYIPSCLLCHGHSLGGCHHQGVCFRLFIFSFCLICVCGYDITLESTGYNAYGGKWRPSETWWKYTERSSCVYIFV